MSQSDHSHDPILPSYVSLISMQSLSCGILHRSLQAEAEWLRLQDRLQPWCKSTTPPTDTCSAMTPNVCFKVRM